MNIKEEDYITLCNIVQNLKEEDFEIDRFDLLEMLNDIIDNIKEA